MTNTRTETDSFGPIEVPADCYWGAQTQRSLGNFPFGERERMPIRAGPRPGDREAGGGAGECASMGSTGKLADAMESAASAIIAGAHDDQFPLTIWQTGSGTQTNMNVNEVIARYRQRGAWVWQGGGKSPVHPNDHVNKFAEQQ